MADLYGQGDVTKIFIFFFIFMIDLFGEFFGAKIF